MYSASIFKSAPLLWFCSNSPSDNNFWKPSPPPFTDGVVQDYNDYMSSLCKKTGRKVLLLLPLYLLGSLSVTLTVLLFWIYFFSSDASICFTMAFPPLRNTDHCCLSFIDFPSNSNWMPRFIA